MISVSIILSIFIIHFIADFIFQDEIWAITKSKNFINLLKHTITYSFIWFIVGFIYACTFNTEELRSQAILNSIYFFCITFVAHTITDYFTSKVTSYLYSKGKYGSSIPNLGFFTMIGFDQVLHYIQLFLTYYLLK